MKIKFTLLSLFLIIPNLGHAFCWDLYISNLQSSVTLNSDLSPNVQLKVNRTSYYDDCRYRIGVTKGSAPTYARKLYNGVSTMDFQITKSNSNQVLKDKPDWVYNSNRINGRFKSGQGSNQKNATLYADLTLSPSLQAGVYSDTYDVKLYQRFFGNYYLYDTKTVTFNYVVADQISISLVNTAAPFNPYDTSQYLNFGNLDQGESLGFDIVMQTTNGYNLKLSSANNGYLKHTVNSSKIKYNLYSHGALLDLANSNTVPVSASTGIGQHPSDGFRVPINVEVGDVTNKLSGQYSDTVTVTVTTYL